jgi:hypothetical protein
MQLQRAGGRRADQHTTSVESPGQYDGKTPAQLLPNRIRLLVRRLSRRWPR